MDSVRFKGARHAARIDQHVGERIRRRRTLLGYTQEQLAEALDISYQQIQKYESGANRVSAGRLYQISQTLEAPITYFFDGLGMEFDDAGATWSNRATIDIVRSLNQIDDPQVRAAVGSLVKALANAGAEPAPAAQKPSFEGREDAGEPAHNNGASHANGDDHGDHHDN